VLKLAITMYNELAKHPLTDGTPLAQNHNALLGARYDVGLFACLQATTGLRQSLCSGYERSTDPPEQPIMFSASAKTLAE
jgi:hypothetical protein